MDLTALSVRAEAVTRRTYNRPKDTQGTAFETWDETVDRCITHQRRLWEEAGGRVDEAELGELRDLMLKRQSLLAGRTLWLGGTEYAFERPCCMFNCSYLRIASVYDVVDAVWLLLNGCGVGFRAKVGALMGYRQPIPELQVVGLGNPASFRGNPENEETINVDTGEWRIKIGDSAEAWAKAFGKMFRPHHRDPSFAPRMLVLDFSQVRGPGERLRGYGWICNGAGPLDHALTGVHHILNSKAGALLDEIDILDAINLAGTVLSSRRAAQISLLDYGSPRWREFAQAKREWWNHDWHEGWDRKHRQQSNNSLTFWTHPTRQQLDELMRMIWDNGGSEPGFINGEAARRRAPWWDGLNPCAEILLPSSGFCNLTTSVLPRFGTNFAKLLRAMRIIARANYRQTCVDLRDEVLQPVWHQTNESLRLCGVSMTGLTQAEWITDYQIRQLRNEAIHGAYSMADELKLPRPKATTTLKPEGTGSKICDVSEGVHKPLGRYIFNWINFSTQDPLVQAYEEAGFRTLPNPTDSNNTLVCFPVKYDNISFTNLGEGKEVNLDSAVTQLRRYRRWNNLWADHNVSCTVSYDEEEIPEVVDWLDRNWDEDFIGVAWLRRADTTKSAKDLGYPYLPQDVVTRGDYESYTARLRPVDWSKMHGIYDIDEAGCNNGMCPVK